MHMAYNLLLDNKIQYLIFLFYHTPSVILLDYNIARLDKKVAQIFFLFLFLSAKFHHHVAPCEYLKTQSHFAI